MMVNNKKQSAVKKHAKKKATADKLKDVNIQQTKEKVMAKKKEAKKAVIAKEDTAKMA